MQIDQGRRTFSDNTSMIELFVKESTKAIEKIKRHEPQHETKHLLRTIRELRYASLEIGAHLFSFLLLNLEIALLENRLEDWSNIFALLEKEHMTLIKNLESELNLKAHLVA